MTNIVDVEKNKIRRFIKNNKLLVLGSIILPNNYEESRKWRGLLWKIDSE